MITIKDEYKDLVIAFGGKGDTILGKYTELDLVKLGILAHQSQDKTILKLFDTLPSLAQLHKIQIRIALFALN